ncbi:ABC transporter permease [Herpetosiphon giganteus]|uniref:ABC transporter permease n=1 Tax=Herpetosiphon giganteus TaxID=2029754 RepID=UPI0019568101|nr:ABC transporter permease [Herpetosiphon giganteus]MBM7842673.1 ABC-2 type transport system permease protein [Herpetosiphon giganteus]
MSKAKWWTIAAHEYAVHAKRKGFLIATFGTPLLLVAIFAAIFAFIAFGDQSNSLGVVDQAGITQKLPATVTITDTLRKDVAVIRFDSEDLAKTALSKQEIDGYVVIPSDYLQSGALRGVANEGNLSSDARGRFTDYMQKALISNQPSLNDQRALEPIDQVYNRKPNSDVETSEGQGVLLFFAPYMFGIFFFIAVFSSSAYLMTALVEEKESRVMEILATSLRPFELMVGKIVGLGLVGLTQISIWVGTALLAFTIARANIEGMANLTLPTNVLLIGVVMFVPAYLMVAGALGAIGASVSAVQEGQQFSGIISILMISPVWFINMIIENPNGPLALFLSLFPFTAPIVMMQRVALVSVPAWQIGLSVLLLIGMALLMIWLAARIVRVGMLRYGKRLTLTEIRRALSLGGQHGE